MFSTQLPRPKLLLALTAFAALLLSGGDALRADEPQMVELTIMFEVLYADQFESFPMPWGEDAIGIVLDGRKPTSSSAKSVNDSFDPFAGTYYLSDGRYMAKGGPTSAFVRVTGDASLPVHGFISLKNCEISDYTSGLASYQMSGVYQRDDEEGTTGLAFIRGWFEVQY